MSQPSQSAASIWEEALRLAPGIIETVKTVLVVDDDPLNRYLIGETLGIDGYNVIEANDGLEALNMLRTKTPDLILLDIDMPGLDGLGTCREIRALPQGRLVPIMMVTGLHDDSAVDGAFNAGASDFLAKPVNWILLRQRVRFLLRHNTLTQDLLRSEQVLAQVQLMTQSAHWEWDLIQKKIIPSAAMKKILPMLSGEVPLSLHGAEKLYTYLPAFKHITDAIAQKQCELAREYNIDDPVRGLVRVHNHFRIRYEGDTAVHVLASVQDITDRYRNEQALAEIFEHSPVGIVEIDSQMQYTLLRVLESREDEIRSSAISDDQLTTMLMDSVPSEYPTIYRINGAAKSMMFDGPLECRTADIDRLLKNCLRALVHAFRESRAEIVFQTSVTRADGGQRSLLVRYPIHAADTQRPRMILTLTDISELLEQQARLHRAGRMVDSSNDGIVLVDYGRRFISVNPSFCRMTGYTADEIIGRQSHEILKNPDDGGARQTAALRALKEQGFFRLELELPRKDGSTLPVLMTVSPLRDDPQIKGGVLLVFTDISHHKESERRLFNLAHFDALTALPNRLSLQENLAAKFTDGPAQPMTLLYIDLDGFKMVNDSLGHATGDLLLSEVAQRLKILCDPKDTLARIGGDEFALLISNAPDREDVADLSRRMLSALALPFHIQGRPIFIGASIGACSFPEDAGTAGDMLRNADSAMYEAKRRGRGQLCFYSHELTRDISRRLAIENELRTAIARNQLFLMYQPKYSGNDGELIGAEALVRWRSPTRGVVPPNEFIGIAEQSGLIIGLGEWVINEACRQIAEWRDNSAIAVPVAINISALHLRQPGLLETIGEAIARFDIDPRLLEIEITEGSLDFRDGDQTPYDMLTKIHEMGLSIAIDDFGTGYSSLSQLKKMPISTLKIDRSFVNDIASDESDLAIISAIVRMASTLKLSVVAEGVETQAQADQLRALECDIFQGYLYARPLEPADFVSQFAKGPIRI